MPSKPQSGAVLRIASVWCLNTLLMTSKARIDICEYATLLCCTIQWHHTQVQDMSQEEEKRLEEELKGTKECISLDANGQALVERQDVWGCSGTSKSLGLRFG